jgi:uncharacterized protein
MSLQFLPVALFCSIAGLALSLNSPFVRAETVTPQIIKAQQLPLTAKFTVKKQTILLEVARTPTEQAMGLMYRTKLADDRGMLFEFNPPRPTAFWMKNTLIPLDMVFLYKGQIKHIAKDVPPCQADPCPGYGPSINIDIDRVVELRAGRADSLGLKVGNRLEIQSIDRRRN